MDVRGSQRSEHDVASPGFIVNAHLPMTAPPLDIGSDRDLLQESEAKYRFLAETIPVQIWTALPDGGLDYVSEQTAAYFGLTVEQLLADGWQNVVHSEDLSLVIESWTLALRTGNPYGVEFRLKSVTGDYLWHLGRAVPQRDALGTVVRWFGTNTNIEEQRAHQREVESLLARLREQNRLLALDAELAAILVRPSSSSDVLQACTEAVVRHLDAAFARIWTTNDAGTVLDLQASAGLYTHLDGPHGRIPVGKFKIGQIAAERTAHFTNQVVGDPRVSDQDWAKKQGMIAFGGCPIVFADKVVGVIAVFARHPLSDAAQTGLKSVADALAQSLERLHSEEKVRLSELWLSTTLSSIGDGVIATDALGAVTFLNPIAAMLTGWSAEDAFGKSIEVVFPIVRDETGAAVESPVSNVLREGRIVGLANHTVLLQRNGGRVPIEDSAAPIRGRDDRITGVVLVFRDAGEKRRVEAERSRLLAAAEEARDKADAASRAKDEFLATASHELRTPLNAILGWARLLRGGALEPSIFARGLETIERNALAQVQLIEDILDGSRIITGKLQLEIRSTDLALILHAAVDAFRPAAAAKSIALNLTLDEAASRIQGDPDRLQQVVWNLVNNALKFTPKCGRIDVRLERVGTSTEVSVTDNGQGISPEFLPHVFERFRQADGSTTRRSGGLGLGLALVRHLVEAHGGTVRADSKGEGLGASFTVTLPVQAVYPETVEAIRLAPVGGVSGVPSAAPSLSGVHILVVDDEPDARDLVATLLRAHGAEVAVAKSAESALEQLRVRAPTVLISDIGMPNTDGYSLISSVRALPHPASEVPAIALTAYAREEDRRRALTAGFQSYASKPVEPAALIRLVSELARSRATD